MESLKVWWLMMRRVLACHSWTCNATVHSHNWNPFHYLTSWEIRYSDCSLYSSWDWKRLWCDEQAAFSKLTCLFVVCNRLTVLPPEIGKLSALKSLNISNNKLTCLPEELGNLLQLEKLDLSHNWWVIVACSLNDRNHCGYMKAVLVKLNTHVE